MQTDSTGSAPSNVSSNQTLTEGILAENALYLSQLISTGTNSNLYSESTLNTPLDADLSSAASTAKDAETTQNENFKQQTKKIATGVGHAVIEIITGSITVLFIACLLIAGMLRSNYTSLIYLTTFFATIAFPSHYPYYHQLPVYRLLMWTPRFFFSIFITIFSLLFLITMVSLQIVFSYGDTEFMTPTVEQILKDFGFVW